MGLFDAFKKKEAFEALNVPDTDIVAIADGKLIDVTTVSDPMFAEKMMGESIAFTYDADKDTFCAPANGTISALFPTGHAFGITMKDGTELLVHIGIDTVKLGGEHYTIHAKQGDTVKKGDLIVEVDLEGVKNAGYDVITPMIVSNHSKFSGFEKKSGKVAVGDAAIVLSK